MIYRANCVFQLDIENNSAQEAWQKVEFVFGKNSMNLGSYEALDSP